MNRKKVIAAIAIAVLLAIIIKVVLGSRGKGDGGSPSDGDLQVINT